MEYAAPAMLALAVAVLVSGIGILSRAAPELSASDLLRADDHVEQQRRAKRQEGALVRALLPPAPAALVRRADLAQLEASLAAAGSPYGFTALEFIRFRVLAAILVGVLVALLFNGSDLTIVGVFGLAGALGGYRLPDLWVSSLVTGRVNRLNKALPDMVDSLVLALESGMDLEAALRRLVPKLRGPLREAFDEVVGELDAGFSLANALARLAERTRSSELGDLLSLIQQSRRLGVSLADGLRTQVVEMRSRRRLRVQESAQRAPLKMMIPLVLFFLPALMLVFLAPAILSFVAGGG